MSGPGLFVKKAQTPACVRVRARGKSSFAKLQIKLSIFTWVGIYTSNTFVATILAIGVYYFTPHRSSTGGSSLTDGVG